MSVTNNNFIIINNNQRFSAESCSFCTVIDIMLFNYDSNNAFLYFFDSTSNGILIMTKPLHTRKKLINILSG